MPLPLAQWSVQGHNATLKKVSYLENFPAYIRNTTTDKSNELLNELKQTDFYKSQERPPYSSSMIRYPLYLHYMSLPSIQFIL